MRDESLDTYFKRFDEAVRLTLALDNKWELGCTPDAILENARIATTATSIEDSRKPAKGPKPYPAPASGEKACPQCGGPMWDNRAKKASGEYPENRPDFSCKAYKTTGCKGAIWPPKDEGPNRQAGALEDFSDEALHTADVGGDDLPF